MKSRMRLILVYWACFFFALSSGADVDRTCINNGYEADGACVCPVGYYGQYCEAFTETYRPEKLFNNQDPKLIVVVNTQFDIFHALNVFRDGILADLALQNGYYKEYYFYGFNNEDAANPPKAPLVSKQAFITALQNLTAETGTDCSEEANLFPQVLKFLTSNKLSETVINIFTQLPAGNTNLTDLQETALAFNVQINVFFAYSPVFCLDSASVDVETLRSLAERTGGIFVPYSNDNRAYVGDLAGLSSSLQLINYDANRHGNSGQVVEFTTRHPVCYAFLSSTDGKAFLSVTSGQAITRGTYNLPDDKTVLYLFIPIGNAPVNLTVNSTAAWSLQIVAKGNLDGLTPSGIRAYTTFTDSKDVDTTYNYLKNGISAYARLHLEHLKSNTEVISLGSVAVLDEDSNGTASFYEVDSRVSSTFEYVTKGTVYCTAKTSGDTVLTKHWLRLSYSIGGFNQLAYVPFKCLVDTAGIGRGTDTAEFAITTSKEASSTEAFTDLSPSSTTEEVDTTTTEITTTNAPTTTEIPTTPVPPPERGSLPSIVIGFSYYYSVEQRAALLRGPALLNKELAETYYSNFLVTPLDETYNYDDTVKRTSSYDQFIENVQSLSWNNNDYSTSISFYETVTKILNDEHVNPRSFVTLLVKPEVAESSDHAYPYLKLLQLATSKQVRIVIVVDISYLSPSYVETLLTSEAIDFYNKLTSVTDGHLIYTQIDVPNPKDGTVSLEDIFAELHTNAFSKKLVLSHIADYSSATVFQCGQVDLRGLSNTRNFTLTASYTKQPTTPGFTNIVSFTNVNTLKTYVATVDFTYRNFNSNLIWANLKLLNDAVIEADALYNVSIRSLIQNIDGSTIVYRLWQELTEEDFGSVSVQYKDLDFNPVDGPDERNSAISQITIHNSAPVSNVIVDFYDANGENVNTLDNYHIAERSSENVFDVSPFVCSGNQNSNVNSVNLTGFYTAKYTVNLVNNLTWVQHVHFWCAAKGREDCKHGTTESGECNCLTHDAPHTRGPYCNIPECSNNGHVIYNHDTSNFTCECKEGYIGDYCEVGVCDESSLTYSSSLANDYATATFGFVYSNRVQLNAFLDELSNLLTSISTPVQKVKHFNFYLSCDGQNFTTIYFGTSKDALVTAIGSVKNNAVADSCDSLTDVDITDAVKYGLQSVSKDVRGLIWIAAGNGVPYIGDLEETYYPLVQGFRQEIYLTVENAIADEDVYNNVTNAMRVNGGELLFIQIKNTGIIKDYLSLILPQPTSLNAYAYNENLTDVAMESNSLVTLTTFNGSFGELSTVNEFESTPCSLIFNQSLNTKVYKCDSTAVISIKAAINLAVSIRVLGGYSPVWTLLSETKQDALESLPVLNSYPTVAFTVENTTEVYNISDVTSDGFTRFTKRESPCNFLYTSTYQNPVTRIGYHNFEFEIRTNDDTVFTKVIPYVVTSSLNGRCKNGATENDNDARCICKSNWNGPDCSRPICQCSGILNVFQNACNCPVNLGGPTCAETTF
uniref:EGF-like domain-containing protein n=1 Tax=Panagrellus redivivus TaxID=6233 RepID=A0A7E4W7V1_PANRE